MEPLSKAQAVGSKMKNDRIKVSLSLKAVIQGTGKGLDPNKVLSLSKKRRRPSFQDYTGQKISLESILNTTCKTCGRKGHFAKNCVMQPGGTKYSLIPDEEEEKEEKHRDRKSSDSDSSDSENNTGKRARPMPKDNKAPEKKKKKKNQHKE
ncbi:hypothetical protein FD755_001327 [Muntiacus reevesi]|uniref:CCHC-type domain-containing protein n=1 Tax=Muntiacus reevesi TaxID=9886 RepID=A0A5J5N134_MUNRE|nr:hypothetical protein FD755_001327 [Muntiacus reevesi]